MTRSFMQLASVACLIASTFAGAVSRWDHPIPQVAVHSADDFCLFLPPKPGLEVAVNEDNGIPFCTKANETPNAKEFPKGFIQIAHYAETPRYVQVTGYFDRAAYSLRANDGGGQYDSHAKHKPVGAMCQDYPYFVSLIEPDIQRFCIRCCKHTEDCNTGRSGYGCLRVVAGDYSKNNSTHSNTAIDSVLDELPPADTINKPTQTNTDNNNPASSGSNPLDAFPEAISHLESSLANNPTTEQLSSQWNAFIQTLADQHPNVAQAIRKLGEVAHDFTSVDEWKSFIAAIKEKLPVQNHNNEWVDA
ncbi:hypothetical protein EC973_005836 [Apophysomyces ossiformis]|uniref:Secreted protein n=1 Tax=Apophysomyces ossiformis TaxID=679940 RepID=A0A8H7EUQ4_9FUNG|nr:hypothetical protein EC973_005836 [Apophysomyces ossiformis]